MTYKNFMTFQRAVRKYVDIHKKSSSGCRCNICFPITLNTEKDRQDDLKATISLYIWKIEISNVRQITIYPKFWAAVFWWPENGFQNLHFSLDFFEWPGWPHCKNLWNFLWFRKLQFFYLTHYKFTMFYSRFVTFSSNFYIF